MNFEWNIKKAQLNKRKHGISFQEGASVFGDPLSLTVPDPDHSRGEHRYLTIGQSVSKLLVVVSHTDREGNIRIISARKATKKEKRQYEEEG